MLNFKWCLLIRKYQNGCYEVYNRSYHYFIIKQGANLFRPDSGSSKIKLICPLSKILTYSGRLDDIITTSANLLKCVGHPKAAPTAVARAVFVIN